jgi:hypothetical protein
MVMLLSLLIFFRGGFPFVESTGDAGIMADDGG